MTTDPTFEAPLELYDKDFVEEATAEALAPAPVMPKRPEYSPSFNASAAVQLLNWLLFDPQLLLNDKVKKITPEYLGRYGVVFDAMTSLLAQGREVTGYSISTVLMSQGWPRGIDQEFINKIQYNDPPTDVSFTTLVEQIIMSHKYDVLRRDIVKKVQDFSAASFSTDALLKLGNINETINQFNSEAPDDEQSPFDKALEARLNPKQGIQLRLPGIQVALPQVVGGRLYVIGGRPKSGKSSLLISLADEMVKAGKRVTFASLEESSEPTINKFYSRDADVSIRKEGLATAPGILNGLTSLDVQALKNSAAKYKRLNLNLISDQNIDTLVHKIIRSKPDVVYIDQLSQIRGGLAGLKNISKSAIYENYIERIRDGIARFLDVPVLLAAQINREGGDKEPFSEHLKDSGAVEEYCDGMILIWRPREYPKDTLIKLELNRWGGDTAKQFFDIHGNVFKMFPKDTPEWYEATKKK